MLEKSPHKNRILEMLQRRQPGYHPLLSLLDIATDNETPVRVQVDCHKTIARFIEPELKAVEVKGEVKSDHGTLRVVHSASKSALGGSTAPALPSVAEPNDKLPTSANIRLISSKGDEAPDSASSPDLIE